MQGESARRSIETAGQDAPLTTDLIRSMAISSAELWNDVLQRLAELQESQLLIAQAVADLGAVVRETLPTGTRQALAAASPLLELPAGGDVGLRALESELEPKGRKARKAKRSAKSAAAAEAKADKAAQAVERKTAKIAAATEAKADKAARSDERKAARNAKAAAKSSAPGFFHLRRHGRSPVEQAPVADTTPQWEPAALPPPPLVTPPPPVSATAPPRLDDSLVDDAAPAFDGEPADVASSVDEEPTPELAPTVESEPTFHTSPPTFTLDEPSPAPAVSVAAPKPLVYTPVTAETANDIAPAAAFSGSEPARTEPFPPASRSMAERDVIPEPTMPPPAAVPAFEPVLAGVGARSASDTASIASEILSNTPIESPPAPPAPSVLVISEDLTLISKSRKRRLQFRVR